MEKRRIDKDISKLSKMSPVKIKNQFIKLNKTNIPPQVKQYIKNKTFSQMPIQKRRKVMNLFGQAAVTQAAATQAAATQAAATQAAATQAAATMAQIAPRTMAMLSSPTITTGSYTAAAGALQGAEKALIAAGQQLAAAQGLTGFGNNIKASYGTLYDRY